MRPRRYCAIKSRGIGSFVVFKNFKCLPYSVGGVRRRYTALHGELASTHSWQLRRYTFEQLYFIIDNTHYVYNGVTWATRTRLSLISQCESLFRIGTEALQPHFNAILCVCLCVVFASMSFELCRGFNFTRMAAEWWEWRLCVRSLSALFVATAQHTHALAYFLESIFD